jgi:hypothetical protein
LGLENEFLRLEILIGFVGIIDKVWGMGWMLKNLTMRFYTNMMGA